jgi:hypothetical protein
MIVSAWVGSISRVSSIPLRRNPFQAKNFKLFIPAAAVMKVRLKVALMNYFCAAETKSESSMHKVVAYLYLLAQNRRQKWDGNCCMQINGKHSCVS